MADLEVLAFTTEETKEMLNRPRSNSAPPAGDLYQHNSKKSRSKRRNNPKSGIKYSWVDLESRVVNISHLTTQEDRRVKIRHAVSGNVVCFPGPASAKNGWSVRSEAFYVRDLVGHFIVMVCQETNTVEKELHKVSAVLTPEGEIAPSSLTLTNVAKDG